MTVFSPQGAQIAPDNEPLNKLIARAVDKADKRAAGVTGALVTLTDPQTQQTRRLAPVTTGHPGQDQERTGGDPERTGEDKHT